MSQEIVLASNALAARIGVEKGHMLDTIKAQCFKTNAGNVSDTQLAAFVSIANEMGVNPLLPGMLYAYPDGRGGIVPMMGPDGVFKKLAEHPDVDSWEVEVFPADVSVPPTHAVARIWRKGRDKALTFTALLSEWQVAANPNWKTRPRHMLHIRALKQCARQVIHGIPFDEDERQIAEINVTPGAEQTQTAPERPKVSRRGGAAAAAASEPVAEQTQTTAEQTAKPNTAPTVDAEIVDDAPQDDAAAKAKAEADAKAEREATEKALKEREAKAKAIAEQAAKDAEAKKQADAAKKAEEKIDTSKVPEVIPGVGIDGFMGKSYPVTLNGTIKTLTPKASGATPYIEMTIEAPQGTFPVVAFNTAGAFDVVKKREDGTFDIMNTAIRVDGFIEFNLNAKLRPKTIEKDGKKEKVADTTKPPALIADCIKDAEESPI